MNHPMRRVRATIWVLSAAEGTAMSARTVRSDWTVSKAWLKQRLSADGDQGAIHE